jgi:hypothetical protein
MLFNRSGSRFTPFLIAIALFFAIILSPYTGIGPESNAFAICALVSIVIGLVAGATSLYRDKATRIRWRILIALLYFPTVVFSLLVAGF